jgi:hypothetical protein
LKIPARGLERPAPEPRSPSPQLRTSKREKNQSANRRLPFVASRVTSFLLSICRINRECAILTAIVTVLAGIRHFDDLITNPRQKTSAAHSPSSSTGRKNLISIAVLGSRDRSARMSIPDMLMFSVSPSCHSRSPLTRYRIEVPIS